LLSENSQVLSGKGPLESEEITEKDKIIVYQAF
jgi:hypothetical protein